MPTEQAQRFLDWARLTNPTMADYALELLEQYADTEAGRFRLAQSYVRPAELLMRGATGEGSGSIQEAQRVCLYIESFIGAFPEGERFIAPLMSLREHLLDLYAYLSPRYTRDQEVPLPEPYAGPRVSRYDRKPVI
jgi:hypothetical protein